MKRIAAIAFLAFSMTANARVLFEGYYKIETKGVHRGYFVQRDELNEQTHERVLTYYIWKKSDSGIQQFGVRATATENFKPLRYAYYEWMNTNSTQTEGTFTEKELKFVERDGRTGKPLSEQRPAQTLPADAVFSSMITQQVAKSYAGEYKENLNLSYKGLSEEDGLFDNGELKVVRMNPTNNTMVFQVMSEFAHEITELFTFRDGEMLGSRNMLGEHLTYLVGTRDEAVGTFPLAKNSIMKVFGDIPHGAINNPVGQSGGKLNAKEVIKNFPVITEKDRQPNAKSPAKPVKLQSK